MYIYICIYLYIYIYIHTHTYIQLSVFTAQELFGCGFYTYTTCIHHIFLFPFLSLERSHPPSPPPPPYPLPISLSAYFSTSGRIKTTVSDGAIKPCSKKNESAREKAFFVKNGAQKGNSSTTNTEGNTTAVNL